MIVSIIMSIAETERMTKRAYRDIRKHHRGFSLDEMSFIYQQQDTPGPIDYYEKGILVSVVEKFFRRTSPRNSVKKYARAITACIIVSE